MGLLYIGDDVGYFGVEVGLGTHVFGFEEDMPVNMNLYIIGQPSKQTNAQSNERTNVQTISLHKKSDLRTVYSPNPQCSLQNLVIRTDSTFLHLH